MPVVTAGPVEVIIRTADIHAAAAYLGVFGQHPRWLPELSADTADRLFGLPAEITEQLAVGRYGIRSSIRLVRGSPPPLEEFTAGGVGVDFYTSDVDLSAKLAAVRGTVSAPPLAWEEDGQQLIEARAVDPSNTFSVFTPQMQAVSRLHPSSFDSATNELHSELVMTSWFVDRLVLNAEKSFWTDILGLRVILDTVMDAADMQILNGLSRPEVMSSLQFVQDGFPCVIDLLSYPELDLADRDPNSGALIGLVLEVNEIRQLEALAALGEWKLDTDTHGEHPVVTLSSPSGIRVIVREARP